LLLDSRRHYHPHRVKIARMKTADFARLFLLAAIWGGSYVLMRVVAPVYGGIGTMWLRIGIAGVALTTYALITREELQLKKWWKQYLFVGLMSSAIPFALIGYGMKTLPAGYGAIMNAASPFFGALFAALMIGEALTPRRISGLLIGFCGVAMLVNLGPLALNTATLLAIGACILATASYGFISVFIKKHVKGAPNMGMAACTLLLAALAVAPVAAPMTPWVKPSTTVLLSLLGLAFLCSGVAYLLYYRLIRDVGPTKAISVTFLIPFFGVLWGAIFLDERLTFGAVLGGITILIGMALVLGIGVRKPVAAS
jgi:drug/metabolite transporter (DMT)-like permease